MHSELVLQQKLGLNLVSPPDELIFAVPEQHLQRRIARRTLGDLKDADFPAFAKPAMPKAFRARVYASHQNLLTECHGLGDDTVVILSEPVTFTAEARAFVLNGTVLDCALYEGLADLSAAAAVVDSLLREMAVPRAIVVDVGLIAGRGWSLIEFNAAWGAGLNGCRPARILPAIEAASRP